MGEFQTHRAHLEDAVDFLTAADLHVELTPGEQADTFLRPQRAFDAHVHLPNRFEPGRLQRDLHALARALERPRFVVRLLDVVKQTVDMLFYSVKTAAEVVVIVARQVRRAPRLAEKCELADKPA